MPASHLGCSFLDPYRVGMIDVAAPIYAHLHPFISNRISPSILLKFVSKRWMLLISFAIAICAPVANLLSSSFCFCEAQSRYMYDSLLQNQTWLP